MIKTVWAVIRNGKVDVLEPCELPEGARVLVTVPENGDLDFWTRASQVSLDSVWDNAEDDVYAQLLEE